MIPLLSEAIVFIFITHMNLNLVYLKKKKIISSLFSNLPRQAWGGVAGNLPGRRGPGGASQQPAEHELAVCPGGQEGQQHPGFYQE